MKNNSEKPFKLRRVFTLFIMLEVTLITVLSWGIIEFLYNAFNITRFGPDILWILLISIVLGATVSYFLGRWIFKPITKLVAAMNKVAKGDFSVRLDDQKGFNDIRQMNSNFNLMAKELGTTEILQTDFVSNVSHEFKTPINAIEGYATLLQGENVSDEQKEYIEKILFNTRRLSNLVGNILLLSKVDNQAIQSTPTAYRLDEQIRQSIVMLEAEWEKKNIELDVDLENVEYTGYQNLMFHVWNNLIGNAIKFSPEAGAVIIKLNKSKDKVVFSVEDRGPGISQDAKLHIFDKFYQSDTSHKEEGNGLGLALVKQILFLSNGIIDVENNINEKGCKFTVILNIE